MSNRKERRRNAILRKEWVEKGAVSPSITKESVGSEADYENTIAQAHELAPKFVQGVIGPDLDDYLGFDKTKD